MRASDGYDTSAKFWRSVAAGALTAAMCGLVYYELFRLTTGELMIFVAIGVGYFVGRAMRIGSHGLGGRRYQVMAALLTYCAIAIGTSAVLLGTADMPVWAYPLLIFAPIIELFVGQVSLAALQLLFVFVGMRWAWGIMAGSSWKVRGPFNAAKSSH